MNLLCLLLGTGSMTDVRLWWQVSWQTKCSTSINHYRPLSGTDRIMSHVIHIFAQVEVGWCVCTSSRVIFQEVGHCFVFRTQEVSRLASFWAAVGWGWPSPARCVSRGCPRPQTERYCSSKVSRSSKAECLNQLHWTIIIHVHTYNIKAYYCCPYYLLLKVGDVFLQGGLGWSGWWHSTVTFVSIETYVYAYVWRDVCVSLGWPRLKWVVTDTKYLTKPSKDWQPHIPTANTDTAYIEVSNVCVCVVLYFVC